MIWPGDLAIFYPHPAGGRPSWEVVLAVVVLAGISVGAFVVRKRYSYLFVGWLWYLGVLVPVIGLVQIGEFAHADRYTYLSQIGIYVHRGRMGRGGLMRPLSSASNPARYRSHPGDGCIGRVRVRAGIVLAR